MKTIYRIEHPSDGLGIFRNRDEKMNRRWSVENDLRSVRDRHENFNTPRGDGLIRHETDFCAYKTLDRLREMILEEELREIVAHRSHDQKWVKITCFLKRSTFVSKWILLNKF